jgi:acyl-CoA hydrolase
MDRTEAICTHHIRPEHLNHHLSLFGGRIAEWMCEAAYIATVKLRGRSDGIVMTRAQEVRFLRPLHLGDVLELHAVVEQLGGTSIVLKVTGTELLSTERCCEGTLVFVTVDEQGRSTEHGLKERF